MGEYLDASKAAFEVPTLETNWTMKDISQYCDDVRSYKPRKLELMFQNDVYLAFKQKVECSRGTARKGKSQEIRHWQCFKRL